MARYIKVGSIDSELIPVNDIYAYIYESEKGKTVLRIKIPEYAKSFAELKTLFSNDSPIYAYEDVAKTTKAEDGSSVTETVVELNAEYFHYCKDYKCAYSISNSEYSIEITKKEDIEIEAEQNIADTLTAYTAIANLYEANL